MTRVRFLSWNVNVFTSRRRDDKVRLLENVAWDIAALQEVDRETERALRDAPFVNDVATGLDTSGKCGMKRPNGVALLSRNQWHLELPARPLPIECDRVTGPTELPLRELRGLWSRAFSDRASFIAASWHAPHVRDKDPARQQMRLVRKRLAYAAMNDWAQVTKDPLVLGFDSNSLTESPWPWTVGGEEMRDEELSFFATAPPHGAGDAFLAWLSAHPDEAERARKLRPDGPLAVTHNRGSKNYPKGVRFDRIMVSNNIEVVSVHHELADALGAGSDHAYVLTELHVPESLPYEHRE
jgi:exonuclease III